MLWASSAGIFARPRRTVVNPRRCRPRGQLGSRQCGHDYIGAGAESRQTGFGLQGSRVTGPEGAHPMRSLLESRFPSRDVSRVAAADRRTRDPAYSAHLWWARRPPAVMRAILVAAVLDAGCSEEDFWAHYGNGADALSGLRVLDPFMGGGCTLVEASRLGACVEGTDVDPTAKRIVAHALDPAEGRQVLDAGGELLEYLRGAFGGLYPDDGGGEPLHWFWVPAVTCPTCREQGLLYRSLVLARDVDKPGAVVRDEPVTVFDPESLELRYLRSASAQ